MGNGVPLLNEYKQEFFWKRFPQTVLGGLKFKLGYRAPFYVYLNQILLFILPWLIAIPFTILVEVLVIHVSTGCYVVGALGTVFVLCVQVISLALRTKNSSVAPSGGQPQNVLSEEDEVDFQSCCGIETIVFVIQKKKFRINILLHALLAGPMCGLGFWYLTPMTLSGIYGIPGGVILHILGWITLCIALYSLTAGPPPETAVYRSTDHYELAPLMRPFYVYLCLIVFIVSSFYPDFAVIDQVLRVFYFCLPLLWTIGILPPVDAFFLWIFEQILVFGFGGSPVASDIRLLVNLFVAVVLTIALFFIPHGFITVILASGSGYILSLNLGLLGNQILKKCRKNHVKSIKIIEDGSQTDFEFGWRWGWKEALGHVCFTLIVLGISFVTNFFLAPSGSTIVNILGYVILPLFALMKLLGDLQCVYVFFGVWRNKLFPESVQRTTIFNKRKKQLKYLGYIRRAIVDLACPVIMLLYLSAAIQYNATIPASFWQIVAAVRAFRMIWQNTFYSMLDISLLHLANLLIFDSTWISFDAGTKLLIIGISRDRAIQLMDKIYFYYTLLITSWTEKKQRRKSTVPMMIVSFVLFPLVYTVIVLATLLSAPLLPMFTLPIFLIGYPRPKRFWPGEVGASANICADTVYYKQMAPQLAHALRTAMANGSLGVIQAGKHYMVRYQDRLLWILILEQGYGYCVLSIKGLELQETSCHTVEAARLDDMFELAFEKEGGFSCCTLNRNVMNMLTPCDAALVKTYSDAKNVLTGIIDSPENLRLVSSSFIKAFVWVMLHHTAKTKKRARSGSCNGNGMTNNNRPVTAEGERFKSPVMGTGSIAFNNQQVQDLQKGGERRTSSKQALVAEEQHPTLNESWTSLNSTALTSPRRRTQNKGGRPQSAASVTASIWSDDNDSLLLEPIETNKTKLNLVGAMQNRTPISAESALSRPTPKTMTTDLPGSVSYLNDADDVTFKNLDMGFPEVDIHQPKSSVKDNTIFGKPQGKSNFAEVTNLAGSMQFSSPYSSKLSLPLKWREIPMEQGWLNELLGEFPAEWYRHVLGLLDLAVDGKSAQEVAEAMAGDEVLTSVHANLTMACYAVVNVLGFPANTDISSLGAKHVYNMYKGNLPWSVSSEWLTEDAELKSLVIKAYRLGVKLMIDQALLGEATSNEEVQEYLEEYEADWLIGCEEGEEWAQAILAEKPNLFSLGHDPVGGTYSSRLMTLQEGSMLIGQLNSEMVQGQWANLSVELLYMTNDDEERYSIQAHPIVMRNLTVQAADPPLGYPIYSSEPLAVPTF